MIGVAPKRYPRMVLVTCVPCEFWSCSHTLGWEGTAPLFMAPPPPWNAIANCVAMRSAGKYDRQLSSSPVSSMPTYTPSPVKPEVFRVDVNGLTVTFTASISHVLSPPVKSLTATASSGASPRSASGFAPATYGRA